MEKQMGNTRDTVCLVEHGYYPLGPNLERVAQALVEDGLDVHVICLRGEREAKHEAVDGVDVHRLPVGRRRGRFGRYIIEYNVFFFLASLTLMVLDLKHRFRVVQVSTMPDYLVFATLVPRLAGARVVLYAHEPAPELFEATVDRWYSRPFAGAMRLVEKLCLKYAHRAVTVTREMRDNFGARGADVNKITVVEDVPGDRVFRVDRYGHLSEKITAVRKDGRRKGRYRVFCHGPIEQRHGLDLVVRAVAHLKDDIPGLEFRFVGEGDSDYASRLLAMAAELNVDDRVSYLGLVSFETLIEEILTADITVVPVRRNSYSVLVHAAEMYEYIALQKPVVVSRLDSVAAYFPDDSLVFFEPDNAVDLGEKLRYVFAHPEEMNTRIERAAEIYETYRWDREKKKCLGVFRSLLSP